MWNSSPPVIYFVPSITELVKYLVLVHTVDLCMFCAHCMHPSLLHLWWTPNALSKGHLCAPVKALPETASGFHPHKTQWLNPFSVHHISYVLLPWNTLVGQLIHICLLLVHKLGTPL